jgi:hypothetical protein
MSAEKLSISLDRDLASEVRSAAADDGVSIAMWLTDAAEAKARQRHLRQALDAYASDFGELDDEEIERLIAEARGGSVVTRPGAA